MQRVVLVINAWMNRFFSLRDEYLNSTVLKFDSIFLKPNKMTVKHIQFIISSVYS